MGSLKSIFHTYGIAAVLLETFFEGETILALAGLAAHWSDLLLPSVVAAGFVRTFVDDQLYFHLGRRRGAAFFVKRPASGRAP